MKRIRISPLIASAWMIIGLAVAVFPDESTSSSSGYPRLQSLYVPMRDGIKIAIDVWLPEGLNPDRKIPAIMRATRYWRTQDIVGASFEQDPNYKTAGIFNDSGYALVLIDARGTGASFGSRSYEMTADEVKDYG
jgi:predicted acyl esterase